MTKIGLISDTHSYLDPNLERIFEPCDEIWHVGDIGHISVADTLASWKPFRAVFGNIDDANMRREYPEHDLFTCHGKKIWMTHIGSYPPNYTPRIRKLLDINKPDLFICGHSHILKVMFDKERQVLHINPGAAGNEGFHHIRTVITFCINESGFHDLNVVELGKRGR
jgi:uncharacterized protein